MWSVWAWFTLIKNKKEFNRLNSLNGKLLNKVYYYERLLEVTNQRAAISQNESLDLNNDRIELLNQVDCLSDKALDLWRDKQSLLRFAHLTNPAEFRSINKELELDAIDYLYKHFKKC